MAALTRRHSVEEFSRRGKEIYQRDVKPVLAADAEGKFVAIDIESKGFEVNSDDFTATERLLSRYPDAQIWIERVGQQAAYRIGAATG